MQGNNSQLKILDHHEVEKMLGIFLVIDSNNSVEVKYIRKVAE